MTETIPTSSTARPNSVRRLTRRQMAAWVGFGFLAGSLGTVHAASDVWTGDAYPDMSWANSTNWEGGSVPGTGDTASFLYSEVGQTIDLGAGVTISNILFNGISVPSYTIGGGGAGNQTLTLNNGGTIKLTHITSSPQTFDANISLSSAANATATIENGYSPNVFLTIAGDILANVGSGNGVLNIRGPGITRIMGDIAKPGVGNNALFVDDDSFLSLQGSSTWSGNGAVGHVPTSGGFPVVVRSGTWAMRTGTNDVDGELVIGGVVSDGSPGHNAWIWVQRDAVLNVSTWLSVGRGNGTGSAASYVTTLSNAVINTLNLSLGYNGGSTLNTPRGYISLYDTASLNVNSTGDFCFIGESDGSDMGLFVNESATFTAAGGVDVGMRNGRGELHINGGTATVGGLLRVGSGINFTSTAEGRVTVDAGSLSVENDIVLGFAGDGSSGNLGRLEINGGTVSIASTTKRWLILNRWDTSPGQLEVNAGELKINADTDIRCSTGNSGSQGVNEITLNGGSITFYSDNAATIGGSGVIDLQRSGGAGSSATLSLNGGTLTVPQITSTVTTGTRILKLNGGTLKPTASTASFISLGAGNARVNVHNNGAVIDTDDFDVGVPDPLLHSDMAFAADTDGGLTKLGEGTLTLSGVNSYNGTTTVSNGTLLVNGITSTGAVMVAGGTLGGTGTIEGVVTVDTGGTLAPGSSLGGLTINGDITLNTGSTNVFEVDGSTPASDLVVAGAAVTYGGELRIVPTGSFSAGESFVLFSGAGATNTSNFASILGSPGSGLVFSFTNGVLSVTSQGGIPSPAMLTNNVINGTNLSLSWPAGEGWILQGQTNILNKGMSTNWVDLQGSESIGSTNIPLLKHHPAVFYRLIYTNTP